LVDAKAGIGDVYDRIPQFVGAELAAQRLAATAEWKSAKIVKCNPDTAHIAVRLQALREGKLLYVPVPELKSEKPYLCLDPAKLLKAGIPFEAVSDKDGAVAHGQPIDFEEMKPLDLVHVGCVAASRAGGRAGKGGGFGDLELGIFREMKIVGANTPIVTCVHDLQLVADHEVPLEPHDSKMTAIFTPSQSIKTSGDLRQPGGVDWDKVLPEQYRDIPILNRLRAKFQPKS
jgi:5-formyltetrahydrofolate cyclo-ligase